MLDLVERIHINADDCGGDFILARRS